MSRTEIAVNVNEVVSVDSSYMCLELVCLSQQG